MGDCGFNSVGLDMSRNREKGDERGVNRLDAACMDGWKRDPI